MPFVSRSSCSAGPRFSGTPSLHGSTVSRSVRPAASCRSPLPISGVFVGASWSSRKEHLPPNDHTSTRYTDANTESSMYTSPILQYTASVIPPLCRWRPLLARHYNSSFTAHSSLCGILRSSSCVLSGSVDTFLSAGSASNEVRKLSWIWTSLSISGTCPTHGGCYTRTSHSNHTLARNVVGHQSSQRPAYPCARSAKCSGYHTCPLLPHGKSHLALRGTISGVLHQPSANVGHPFQQRCRCPGIVGGASCRV